MLAALPDVLWVFGLAVFLFLAAVQVLRRAGR